MFLLHVLSLNLKQMNKILKQFMAYDTFVYMFVENNFLSTHERKDNQKAMIGV